MKENVEEAELVEEETKTVYKGVNNSYFHNGYIKMRSDETETRGLIASVDTEEVICRLNGYAVVPIEEYCALVNEPVPEDIEEKIKNMNVLLEKSEQKPQTED